MFLSKEQRIISNTSSIKLFLFSKKYRTQTPFSDNVTMFSPLIGRSAVQQRAVVFPSASVGAAP